MSQTYRVNSESVCESTADVSARKTFLTSGPLSFIIFGKSDRSLDINVRCSDASNRHIHLNSLVYNSFELVL